MPRIESQGERRPNCPENEGESRLPRIAIVKRLTIASAPVAEHRGEEPFHPGEQAADGAPERSGGRFRRPDGAWEKRPR